MNWEYDTWNRIRNITYPDGEKVHYSYDRGGNLKSMSGEKDGQQYAYINQISYNRFGAKTDIVYGNGTSAHYQYDVMQRLSELTSYTANNTQMQQIVYEYDNVSNITQVTNSAAPVNGLGGQYMNGHYYDNLYRLIYSESYWNNGYGYVFAANYARDGKITHKETYANGNTGQTSSYNFYYYNRNQPHTLNYISDGQQFEWDKNGNLTGHYQGKGFEMRKLCWDEENRLSGVADDKYASIYYYDAAGERTVKITGANEWIDVNGTPQGFAYLNDLTLYTSPYLVASAKGYTKHYYIEGQRVTSKLGGGGLQEIHEPVVSVTEWKEKHRVIGNSVTAITKCLGITKFEYSDPLPDYCEVPGRLPLLCKYRERIHPETDLYFYHPDHLGSSSWITDKDGNPIQHLTYMPFGEEFVDQQTSDWSAAYKFSGKEKDVETGYNYFHARYYSPDISIFISVDPLSDVLPHQSSYVYCSNNPIGRIDPDGMFDTRAEARQYRRENDTGGRIRRNSSGNYSIINKQEGFTYYKDRSLADYHGETMGLGEDGVLKAVMVNADKPSRIKQAFANMLTTITFSFNWYYDNLGLGELPPESSTYEKFDDVASTLATTIFIGGMKMDKKVFHKKYKNKILRKVGEPNYINKVGKNPNINVKNGKIILEGQGPYRGKNYPTNLEPADYLGK